MVGANRAADNSWKTMRRELVFLLAVPLFRR